MCPVSAREMDLLWPASHDRGAGGFAFTVVLRHAGGTGWQFRVLARKFGHGTEVDLGP